MRSSVVGIVVLFGILISVFTSSAKEVMLTESEENLICRFAVAACGEDAPLAAKLGAVNVILNRLADSRFPQSVAQVIYNGGFECVENGLISQGFSRDDAVSAADALYLALRGHDPTGGAIYFAEKGDSHVDFSISFEVGKFVFGL